MDVYAETRQRIIDDPEWAKAFLERCAVLNLIAEAAREYPQLYEPGQARNSIANRLAVAYQELDKLSTGATRSAAGPAAQGWKYLKAGDTLQQGDEWQHSETGDWIPMNSGFGAKIHELDRPLRRRLPAAPAVGDVGAQALEAMEAVADDVCSHLCPSVKKTGAEWTHVEKCVKLRAAVTGLSGKGG